MAGNRELVLYYCPPGTAHKNKVKAVLVQQGIRIRNVTEEELSETVGFLAGLEEFSPLEERADGESLPREVLVMKDFTNAKMDQLFMALRRAKVPKIALKAILTPYNAAWSFRTLYDELLKEHLTMSGQMSSEEGVSSIHGGESQNL